jgi:hypothetical protein
MIAKDAVNPASIDVTFDDIGGARAPHPHLVCAPQMNVEGSSA